MNLEEKLLALASIYRVHDEWIGRLALACEKGCGTCCTRSVPITTLEGEFVMREDKARVLAEKFCRGPLKSKTGKGRTTNSLARMYMTQEDVDEEAEDQWDYTPCPFLEDNCCAIYNVRPMMCRSFISMSNCSTTGAAEVPPHIVSLNTAVFQIIEALDMGGHWGNMFEVLRYQTGAELESEKAQLAVNEKIPGFLVPPEDMKKIHKILEAILGIDVNGKSLRDQLEIPFG